MEKRVLYKRYTEEEKNEIRRLYNQESKTYSQIAEIMGMPKGTIWVILNGVKQNNGIKYPHRKESAIMELEVVDPMPRKISGEDLKKENRDLRNENEYLKDKVAYLEALYETSMAGKAEAAQKKRDLRQFTKLSEKKGERT